MEFIDNFPLVARKFAKFMQFTYHVNYSSFPTLHTHDNFWEFTIITNGSATNFYDHSGHAIPSHSVIISSPIRTHALYNNGSDMLRYINIIVHEDFFNNFTQIIPSFSANNFNNIEYVELSDTTINKIESIIHEITLTEIEKHEQRNSLLFNIFLILFQKIYYSSVSKPIYNEPDKKMILENQLDEIFKKSQTVNLKVKDICDKLYYSRTHLNRLFYECFNMSPHDYLTKIKLSYAKNMLHTSNTPITNIALMVGYSNLGQFNKLFKKEFSLTPREFRKKYAKSKPKIDTKNKNA